MEVVLLREKRREALRAPSSLVSKRILLGYRLNDSMSISLHALSLEYEICDQL